MLKKGDFVEIEFTGKVKDGDIFDSNIKKDLEKINSKAEAKPFIFCLGEEMFLKGVEDFLTGKSDKSATYEIEFEPEKAFGNRNPKLVQMIPMKAFQGQNVAPTPGAMFNFDGRPAKILTVSGGRVMADFNNPMAGKTVRYTIKLLRKVEDINEKAKALIDFLFRKELKFEIKDKKITLYIEKPMMQSAEMFKDKFKNMLGLELQVKEQTDKKSQ